MENGPKFLSVVIRIRTKKETWKMRSNFCEFSGLVPIFDMCHHFRWVSKEVEKCPSTLDCRHKASHNNRLLTPRGNLNLGLCRYFTLLRHMSTRQSTETNLEFRRLSLLTMLFIEPSPEELTTVSELKEALSLGPAKSQTYSFTDVKILRFLRGRNHLFEKTLHGLIKHVEWREENKVDGILQNATSFNVELEQRKIFNAGFDLKCRPIICLIVRRHNKDNRNIEEVESSIIYSLELAMKRVKEVDEKILIVFDLAQFSLTCMDYEVVQILVKILQYNYPEILSAALIVNSPIIFSACWQIIRHMIDPVTAAKCLFIKTSQLSDYILPSDIPEDIFGFVRQPTENSPSVGETEGEIDGISKVADNITIA